jgi:ADP-ribose pyrophosphatase YjhB (NUDIX family)
MADSTCEKHPAVSENRRYPPHPILAASVAVMRDGCVLLASRGRPPGEGLYSLPGGRVETGETLAAAALRELREEVGVEAEVIGRLGWVEFIERDDRGRVREHLVVAAHAAIWTAGEPRTGPEAKDVRWMTERDAADLPVTEGLAAILAEAFAVSRRVGLA